MENCSKVVEKSLEWGENSWLSALDVKKAFDRVVEGAFTCRSHADLVDLIDRVYTQFLATSLQQLLSVGC